MIEKIELEKLQAFLATKDAEDLLGYPICGKFDADKIYHALEVLERLEKYQQKLDVELLRETHIWNPFFNNDQTHSLLEGLKGLTKILLDGPLD